MPESYTPSPVVEFAFGYQPFQTIPTSAWVDVSTYASFTDPDRGRSSELEQFSASTMTVRLEADDRRFDPLNADGPYFGQLVPNTPVRLRALHSAVYYPLWYGYADAFKHRPTTFTSTVEVPCTDAFKILAGKSMPDSVWSLAMADTSSDAWYRLSDAGSPVCKNATSASGYDGRYPSPQILPTPSTVAPAERVRPLLGDAAIAFSPNDRAAGIELPTAARRASFPFSLNVWVKLDETYGLRGSGVDTLQKRIFTQEGSTAGANDGWRLVLYAQAETFANPLENYASITSWTVRSSTPNGGGAGASLRTNWAATLEDLRPHMLTLTCPSSGAPQLYIDGVACSATTAAVPEASVNRTGQWIGTGDRLDQLSFPGRIDELALYSTTLTVDEIRALYTAATVPWDGDSTGQRIGRVLDAIGWPADLRDIDDGEIMLGPANFEGMKALEYLQLIVQTEQGRLFMSADGKIMFHGNGRTINGTSAYTFTDDGSGTGILDPGVTFSLDDAFLFEEAVVSRRDGAPQRALADGVTDPVRTYSADGLLFRDDRQALQLASRMAFRYGTATTRVDGWTVQPEQDPDAWATILGLELGDVVTVELTPASTGDPITVDLFLEQIKPQIDGDDWTIDYWGSPVDTTNYMIIGGDGASQGIATGVIR